MKIVALEYRRAIGLVARFICEESMRVIGIRSSRDYRAIIAHSTRTKEDATH